VKFVNREKEIKYLNDHFESEPNSLLFLYGPKSSGKSTLLSKVVEELDNRNYAVNYLDLRGILIYDFNSFLDIFFPKTLYGKVKDIAEGVTINTGFFGISVDDEKMLKQNAFKIMEDKLKSAMEKGKNPVIVIDEIQLLRNIALNGERYLIDELFNLFVRLTKVIHVAHIVLSTSDSYYLNEIYNSSRLQKTSQFLFVDHFSRDEVEQWLLEESFTQSEIDTVWHYIGGCPWEISELIIQKSQGKSVEKVALDFVNDEYSKIREYRNILIEKELHEKFDRIIEVIVEKGYYLRNEQEDVKQVNALLKEMLAHDFWFYKTDEQKIIANSKSIWWAFEKLIKGKSLS
jgi:AAA+ ATPase superfamily predicted ATPase